MRRNVSSVRDRILAYLANLRGREDEGFITIWDCTVGAIAKSLGMEPLTVTKSLRNMYRAGGYPIERRKRIVRLPNGQRWVMETHRFVGEVFDGKVLDPPDPKTRRCVRCLRVLRDGKCELCDSRVCSPELQERSSSSEI